MTGGLGRFARGKPPVAAKAAPATDPHDPKQDSPPPEDVLGKSSNGEEVDPLWTSFDVDSGGSDAMAYGNDASAGFADLGFDENFGTLEAEDFQVQSEGTKPAAIADTNSKTPSGGLGLFKRRQSSGAKRPGATQAKTMMDSSSLEANTTETSHLEDPILPRGKGTTSSRDQGHSAKIQFSKDRQQLPSDIAMLGQERSTARPALESLSQNKTAPNSAPPNFRAPNAFAASGVAGGMSGSERIIPTPPMERRSRVADPSSQAAAVTPLLPSQSQQDTDAADPTSLGSKIVHGQDNSATGTSFRVIPGPSPRGTLGQNGASRSTSFVATASVDMVDTQGLAQTQPRVFTPSAGSGNSQRTYAVGSLLVPAVTPGLESPVTQQMSKASGIQLQDGKMSSESPAMESRDQFREDERILPQPTLADANQDSKSNSSSDAFDFEDLHAKFRTDLRDLEDLQDGNAGRLLEMSGLLATAYAEVLHDQARYLDILNQLEKTKAGAEDMIHRFSTM